mgnify:CR=1 FL=1
MEDSGLLVGDLCHSLYSNFESELSLQLIVRKLIVSKSAIILFIRYHFNLTRVVSWHCLQRFDYEQPSRKLVDSYIVSFFTVTPLAYSFCWQQFF